MNKFLLILLILFLGLSYQTQAHAQSRGDCLADGAVFQDIRKQKAEIKIKQEELTKREEELKILEKELNANFSRLEEVKKELLKLETSQSGKQEESVSKLVETFEKMSPKKAAGILAKIDDSLAVAAITRISSQKLAKIMNVMDVKRSTELSEMLTGAKKRKLVKDLRTQ